MACRCGAARRGHHVGISLVRLGAALSPGWSCSRRRPCPCTPPQRADIPGAAPRRLVVLAVEVGGRWSDEAASFVRALARAKAREVPVRLRSSLVAVLVARWSALLSHAAMSAFAATFTERAGALSHADGALPPRVSFLQMQVRRPSPLAGRRCTSHSRWPPCVPSVPGGSP